MSWWLRGGEQGAPAGTVGVAPSLLAADFSDLRGELGVMEEAGADLFHLDVMDGHFVPNLTLGPALVAALRPRTLLPLDVHLMVEDPGAFVAPFAAAGADALTVHVECPGAAAALDAVRARRVRAGVSLNPGTPLERLQPLLGRADLVLVMAVQPGFGGQPFQPAALERLARLRRWREEGAGEYAIAIDGGVDGQNAPACRAAGADILVAGTFLFRAADRAAAVAALRGA